MTQTEAARCGCSPANQFYQRHGFTPNGESERAIYYVRWQ